MATPRRSGKVHWSALVFLVVFTIVAFVVAFYALKPGAMAAQTATETGKLHLVAWYRLLLTVLLFCLFVGIVIFLRIGRFFFPRPTAPRAETKYVDAWAESAKRVQVPPADEEDDDAEAAE
jgi:Na+/H+-dicarboxylate symporter